MSPETVAPHFCHAANNGGQGCPECGIPPIYNPGLSSDVAAAATRIARERIAEYPEYVEGRDYQPLYRIVRVLMGRSAAPALSGSALDDESISQGIINALNQHRRLIDALNRSEA